MWCPPFTIGVPAYHGSRQRCEQEAKNDAGRVLGLLSVDLMQREELGYEKIGPWRLEAMCPAVTLEEFAQRDGQKS